ncbi:MAG TPA: hypothetical protein VGG59_00675 [Acidobacteriaceae bacterium]|jgi:hypothetical protein
MTSGSGQCGRSTLTPRQRITFLAALILVASHFSLAYISEAAPFLSLRAFAAGLAPQPFQERALTAWILRGANRFDSPQFEAALHRLLPAMGDAFNETTLVLLIIAWISMAASIVVTRETLLKLTGDALLSSWAAFLVPYMAYFTYILNFGPHFLLPYDLPSLFFFCAGLYLLVMRRPLLLVPLIAIATLNRETSLFLIGFYLLFELSRGGDRKRRVAVLAYAAAMLAAWIAMRLVVLHLYGHNPVAAASRMADLKLWQNLGFLVKPQHWPAFASVFGFTLPIVFVYRRYLKPDFLTRGLIVIALWLALMLFVGVLIEIRIFGELISYMSVALGVIVHRFLTTRSEAQVRA